MNPENEFALPRWRLRFRNYLNALHSLESSLDYRQVQLFEPSKAQLEMELQARIKAFEYTYELGWKTLKDLLEEEGNTDVTGSKSVIRLAAQVGILPDSQIWLDMVADRNLTTHTFDQGIAERVVNRIANQYRKAFLALANRLNQYPI
jgi:nucleotidyltransferase substrate binding protein (TIGR01987 family)